MSGSNDNSDPQQAPALEAAAVEGYVADALSAVAAATSTAELKQVRIDHAGDRSPLALANRQIGGLPPAARKEAGARVGRARGQVSQAIAARQRELAEEELAQALVTERIDMTLPADVLPRGALHPITKMIDDMCDVFVAMGWEVAEGPSWRPNGTTSMPSTSGSTILPAASRTPCGWSRRMAASCCAPRPRPCRSVPCWSAVFPSTSSARQGVPRRRV